MPYIGLYEQLGMKFTKKEVQYLKSHLQKSQPFLRQGDIVLFRNTRRVRRIIALKRRNVKYAS